MPKRRKIRIKKQPLIVLIAIVFCITVLTIYIMGADVRKLKNIGYNKEEISFIKKE